MPLSAPEFADAVTAGKIGKIGQSKRDVAINKALAKDLPFLMTGDHLKVRNDGNRTIVFRWARKFYMVAPGEEEFVIFEALVDAMGDPRSMEAAVTPYNDGQGEKGIVMERYAELTRLFARYGVEQENLDELVRRAPTCMVETLSGQKVVFPSQRPDMLPFPVPLVDDHAVNADTTRMIDNVAAENAELRERSALQEDRLNDLQRRIEELTGARTVTPEV